MSSNRTDTEARPPLYITATQYAPNIHNFPSISPSTYPASPSPRRSTMSTATVTPSYLSPLKRKRDEASEIPWRYSDDDGDDVGESAGLVRQLEELSLAVFKGAGGEDIAAQAVRRPIRKMRVVATATASSSATMAAATEVGELGAEAVMDSDDGDGDVERPLGEPNGDGGGGVEWVRVDEPPLNTEAMSAGDDEMEGTRNRSHSHSRNRNRSSSNSSNNRSSSGAKRARLRSPPLSRMDTDSAESESEDVDSDAEHQQQRGIGYRPTPTQRYVRSQKRMQQIKEYKARISKEARESRRRRRSFPESERMRVEGEKGENDGGGGGEGRRGESVGVSVEKHGRSVRKTVQFKIDMEVQ